MQESRYKLKLTGLDAELLGEEGVKKRIAKWVKGSGVRNISSGVVRCDMSEKNDTAIYSVHFDSSHWTGRGFEGFDKKNPGTPLTDFS